MPDLILMLKKRWKLVAVITVAALAVAAITLLMVPKTYLSTTTALPANSLTTDKASVFNTSIHELYSSLGSPDDLDRFLGTGRLDTVYIAVARQHNLQQHYGVAPNDHAQYNAALKLKKKTRIERTEYGELQVRVWDADRNMAAALANSIMQQLQLLHQHLQSESNTRVLQKLQETHAHLKEEDTLSAVPAAVRQSQAAEYQRLIAQYNLMVSTNPPALLVVEKARPALTPDKPYVWPTLLLTFFTALLFSFLAALFLESRQHQNV